MAGQQIPPHNQPGLIRSEWRNVLLLVAGATVQAFAYAAFQVPYDIAPGGISGLSLVVNSVLQSIPVGTIYFLLNIPLFVLGFFNLGRWRFLAKALVAVTVFSVFTNVFVAGLPQVVEQTPLTNNILLSAFYGATLGGLGGGLIYRSGASAGGTSILGRVVQLRTGIPLSQVLLMTDGIIVALMGLVFGWENALYALLMLFLWGMAADYALEGPGTVRTVTIVTEQPEPVILALREQLGRTVSHWPVTGGYSGAPKQMLFCTVTRPQVEQIKRVILTADPNAFFVVGDAHNAVGGGFGNARGERP